MIKIDMHVHTKYSICSGMKLKQLLEICKRKNIIPIITDHNTIEGALKYPGRCVIGEEIETKEGEVIGLFLKYWIRPGKSFEETCDEIEAQGGLIYIPHPFERLRKESINGRVNMQRAHIIEGWNGRTLIPFDNLISSQYAVENNIVEGIGSDAHFPNEVGKGYVEMEEFTDAQSFLKSLRNAFPDDYHKKIFPKIIPHVRSKILKWRRK